MIANDDDTGLACYALKVVSISVSNGQIKDFPLIPN